MKRYSFRFVTRQGQAGVVEVVREGVTERCLLPMDIIANAKTELTAEQIDSGIPYGLPFGEFLASKAEIALHNAGIWTLKDLQTNLQKAVGAINSVGLKLSEVIRAAETHEKQDHTIKAVPTAPKITKSKKEKLL